MATHSSTLALKIPWMEELCAGHYPWGRKESDTTGQLNDTTTERQQTISVKGHRVNILGTTGQAVCVTTTQLCGHSKCSHKTEGEDLKGAVFQQNLIPDAKT